MSQKPLEKSVIYIYIIRVTIKKKDAGFVSLLIATIFEDDKVYFDV